MSSLLSNNQNKKAVAVDLGSNQIKVVVTDKSGSITQTVIAHNPLGYGLPLKTPQIEPLAELLKNIFAENKLPKQNLYIAMPEKHVSTQVISIPTLTDSELASSINWQAQQYIPIPKEELVLNYQVLYRPDKKDTAVKEMRVLLTGINKTHLNNLTATYRQAGLEPTVLETESIATLRHLHIDNQDSASMIVNLGASGMDLIVVKGSEIDMAISHQTGSDMITKAIMSTFNLNHDQAEQYKKAYGIDPRQAEGKIAQAIVPVAQIILGDIKNTIAFYNRKNPLRTLSRVYICGGGSLMPSFPELLATNLNLEIVPLDIFADLTGEIPQKDQLLFPVASGLIKRNM
ncbi:pilus assembly protein PilM [bacterium]|nr:pilus assembly protein PilM [bacterium]